MVLARKGGQGKSSIARCLAVQALLEGRKSAVLDVDKQGTSTLWGQRRDELAPAVVSLESITVARALEQLERDGAEIVFIDTPPNINPVIATSITAADASIIVTEPLPEGVEQVGATVELVSKFSKPSGIVITRVIARSSAFVMARSALAAFRTPVCPTAMTQLLVHPFSAAAGQTPQEYEPAGRPRRRSRRFTIGSGKGKLCNGPQGHQLRPPNHRSKGRTGARAGGTASAAAQQPFAAPGEPADRGLSQFEAHKALTMWAAEQSMPHQKTKVHDVVIQAIEEWCERRGLQVTVRAKPRK